MEELIKSLKMCHANTFVMYFKAHAFHWNIEGMFFPVYHEFFGNLYTELFGAVDPIAEEIRTLGSYAATGLADLYKDTTLTESNVVGSNVKEMLSALDSDNTAIIECLNKSFTLANEVNNQGLADFISGRIDIHKKHGWMIQSCLKGV